jgi:hypothetical protein
MANAMPGTLKKYILLLTVNLIFLLSCNTTKHNRAGVESAMQQYDHLILKLDADAISGLFTPDGNLGNIAIGRDSIRKFLSSFKNIRVLSQSSVTTSINILHDTAIQKGTYVQTDIVAEKDTFKVKGEYTAKWQWLGKEGWHIRQMTTIPK